jgi:crossover junction endonuclease EME1
MAIQLGSSPFNIFNDPLSAKLREFGATVSPLSTDLSVELRSFSNLVSWKRLIKSLYDETTKTNVPLPQTECDWRRENTYMLYFTAADVYNRGENVRDMVGRLRRAATQTSTTSGKPKSCRIMIMVEGWLGYKGKPEDRRKHERMFVRLQMERCSVVHVEGIEDAVTWLYNLTADLGMKPHK